MYELTSVPDQVLRALQGADRHGVKKYPFAEMQVGQAFAVDSGKAADQVKSAARAYASRNGARFSFVPDHGKLHVIRIA